MESGVSLKATSLRSTMSTCTVSMWMSCQLSRAATRELLAPGPWTSGWWRDLRLRFAGRAVAFLAALDDGVLGRLRVAEAGVSGGVTRFSAEAFAASTAVALRDSDVALAPNFVLAWTSSLATGCADADGGSAAACAAACAAVWAAACIWLAGRRGSISDASDQIAEGDDSVSVRQRWCCWTLLSGRRTRATRLRVAVSQGSTFGPRTTLTDEARGAKAAAEAGRSWGGMSGRRLGLIFWVFGQ